MEYTVKGAFGGDFSFIANSKEEFEMQVDKVKKWRRMVKNSYLDTVIIVDEFGKFIMQIW